MDAIKTLEDILNKKTKELSKENRERAVEALLELSTQRDNYGQIVEFLYKFHYSVSGNFFKEFSMGNDDESVSEIAKALTSSVQFKKGKAYQKELSAVLALAIKGKYQVSFFILDSILKQSEKGGKFTGASLKDFKIVIINKDGMQYIDKMRRQIEKGEVTCNEIERKRLDRFFKALQDKVKTENEKEESAVVKRVEMQNPSKAQEEKTSEKNVDVDNCTREDEIREEKKNLIPDNTEKAIDRIDKAQKEILTAIQKLSQIQSNVESLSALIARRDEEINALKANLTERENRISSLVNIVNEKERELTKRNQQIEDLTERLRVSMQMDDISKNQEVLTLKNDISEALKLDYSDFIKSKEKPCDEDLFEAYRLTLSRIFKLLKRFGIDCQ